MAFIPLPNGFKVAVEFQKDGNLVVSIFYVTSALPVTTVNLTALATIFRDWWVSDLRLNTVDDMAIRQIVATDWRVANGQQVTLPVVASQAGAIVQASAPNNVCIALRHNTGFSGRSFRGRTFFAGVVATEITDNLLLASRVTALLEDMTALNADLATGGFVHVVASFFTAGAPRATGLATAVIAYSADTRVDTQRRRLPGEGA